MKTGKTRRIRLFVMLSLLVIVAVGYFTAVGIGNACGIGFESITLVCPLGALLAMISERTLIPMAALSVVAVLVVCIVLGKVFCAWACPVHFMSRFSRKGEHAKKREKPDAQTDTSLVAAVGKTDSSCTACSAGCSKSKGMKIDSRHGILASAIVSTLIFGFPVFCLVCPVGLTFATVLLVMQLFAFGATTWTVIVFPLIVVAEIFLLPRWCKTICPLGALWSLMSGLNKTFRPQVSAQKCLRHTQGIACSLCEKVCHEGINLHDVASGETTLNDCTKCRACSDVCPEDAITFPLLSVKNTQLTTKGGESLCPSSKE